MSLLTLGQPRHTVHVGHTNGGRLGVQYVGPEEICYCIDFNDMQNLLARIVFCTKNELLISLGNVGVAGCN